MLSAIIGIYSLSATFTSARSGLEGISFLFCRFVYVCTTNPTVRKMDTLDIKKPSKEEQRAAMESYDALAATLEQLRSETPRSEEHTSELQSLMRISYAVLCLKKKTKTNK